jgi:hypothetical protein
LETGISKGVNDDLSKILIPGCNGGEKVPDEFPDPVDSFKILFP